MKLLTLLFVAVLSTTMFIGCERQFVAPVDHTDALQSSSQLVQHALSDLADTADERGFVDLSNAANGVAETLAMDDGTSVEPLFSKIVELAGAATILGHAFVDAGCAIELQGFSHASIDAVKAYTIRKPAEMEQALQHLAEEVGKAERQLKQLRVESHFMPFAFGYGPAVHSSLSNFWYTESDDLLYEPGVILIQYDSTIRPVDDTRDAVNDFLVLKGYAVQGNGLSRSERRRNLLWFHLTDYIAEGLVNAQVQVAGRHSDFESIDLGADIDPLLIMGELRGIPGVTLVQPEVFTVVGEPVDRPEGYYSIQNVAEKYNEAWCQGDFDAIDRILIEHSKLEFFNYAFGRSLADIYAEEIPEDADSISINRFSLRWISITFLEVYSWDPEKPLDEIISRFRKSIKDGHVRISHTSFDHYYQTTDYWKQLVTDHLNQ